jgi:hypothetical protein
VLGGWLARSAWVDALLSHETQGPLRSPRGQDRERVSVLSRLQDLCTGRMTARSSVREVVNSCIRNMSGCGAYHSEFPGAVKNHALLRRICAGLSSLVHQGSCVG